MTADQPGPASEGRIYSVLFVILAAALAITAHLPYMADQFMGEDKGAELATAVLCFLGAYVSFQIFRMRAKIPGARPVLYLLGSALFFLIGAEEISWGQRIFILKPIRPETIPGGLNLQREFNIHNLGDLEPLLVAGFGGAFLLFGGILPVAILLSKKVRALWTSLGLPLMPKAVCAGFWVGILLLIIWPGFSLSLGEISFFRRLWPRVPYEEMRELYFTAMLFAYLFAEYFHLLKHGTVYGSDR